MAGNLLYVNARIKSLENGLISPMQLSRLTDADTLADAYKILQECGYGAGLAIDDYRSFENLISAKEREATEFFKENLIEKTGLDAVLLKNDYHNAKVLIKAKYLRLDDVADILMPDGNYSAADMKANIFDDEYDKYPKDMAEALDKVDVAFADGNRSPRFIDITLDKAMYKDMGARIRKYKQQVLVDWLTQTTDTANISAFVRCRRLGLDAEYFAEGFIEGGKLDKDLFVSLFDAGNDAVKDKMKYTDYGDLVALAFDEDSGLVRFETAIDNRVVKLLKDNKYDMFSVAPILGFYFGQLTEIKAIKLTMSTIKNKLDKTLLKQRLRELYA